MTVRVVIEGEAYLALEAVAECYRVEVDWLREVYRQGLLGTGYERQSTIVIACRRLDRVAKIVRLHYHYGLDLEGVAVFLGVDDPE